MDNEEYQEIMTELKRFGLDARVTALVTNYHIDQEDFAIKYEAAAFNLPKEMDNLIPAQKNKAILDVLERELSAK